MATPAQRKQLGALMDLCVNNKATIHWREFRPMDWTSWSLLSFRIRLKLRKAVYADCSESTTALCRWAGLRDPNNNHYNGYGNTDSIFANPLMRHYHDPRRALVGAIVVFGSYPGTRHVAMVRHPDPHNPTLFSLGHESSPDDPAYYEFVNMSRYFNGQFTFCSISKL